MDSPSLQPSLHLQRMRTSSNTLAVHSSVDARGAVRKRTAPRHRSVSTSQVERLHQLAVEQSNNTNTSLPPTALNPQWITPQSSPQPHVFSTEPSVEPFPQWTVPTPPRSDSGLPTVSLHSNDEPVTTGISSTQDFNFEPPTASAEMSSLGFLLPSQYGSGILEAEPSSYSMEQQNYAQPVRISQPATTGGTAAYAQTISSSPALYQSRTMPASNSSSRRHSELPSNSHADPSYGQNYRRISNPYDSMSSGEYSMAPTQNIPSISGLTHSPLPSPHIGASSSGGLMPQYNTAASRSPNLYDPNIYGQPFSTAPPASQHYASSQSLSYPPPFVGSSVNEVLAKPLGSDSSIRVLNQRPKPQCWEHGCNGRQFSTFSNLLRHQREKSGTAAKSYCPKCGAEFTRTTARNGHLQHDKCTKQRRQSDDK